MINNLFLYILLAIITVAVPIKYNCQHRFLLSFACFFMGSAILTAILHSNLDNGKWVVIGLNSVGMMIYYFRFKALAKINSRHPPK
jgi:hypothetical protein